MQLVGHHGFSFGLPEGAAAIRTARLAVCKAGMRTTSCHVLPAERGPQQLNQTRVAGVLQRVTKHTQPEGRAQSQTESSRLAAPAQQRPQPALDAEASVPVRDPAASPRGRAPTGRRLPIQQRRARLQHESSLAASPSPLHRPQPALDAEDVCESSEESAAACSGSGPAVRRLQTQQLLAFEREGHTCTRRLLPAAEVAALARVVAREVCLGPPPCTVVGTQGGL